jgi:hypothetical protein
MELEPLSLAYGETLYHQQNKNASLFTSKSEQYLRHEASGMSQNHVKKREFWLTCELRNEEERVTSALFHSRPLSELWVSASILLNTSRPSTDFTLTDIHMFPHLLRPTYPNLPLRNGYEVFSSSSNTNHVKSWQTFTRLQLMAI